MLLTVSATPPRTNVRLLLLSQQQPNSRTKAFIGSVTSSSTATDAVAIARLNLVAYCCMLSHRFHHLPL